RGEDPRAESIAAFVRAMARGEPGKDRRAATRVLTKQRARSILVSGGHHGQRQQRPEERNEETEKGRQQEVTFRLESDRLIIRPLRPDDREPFIALMADPEVTRWVHGGLPYQPHEVEEFFTRCARNLAQHGVCMGALEEKESARMVGISGVQ